MLKEIPIKIHRTLPPTVVKSYDHCAFQVVVLLAYQIFW